MKKRFIAILVCIFSLNLAYAQNNVDTETFIKTFKTKPTSILIDVRTPEEWAKGSIKAAKTIDYKNPNFKSKIAEIDKFKPVFLFCAAGVRSGGAAKIMKEMGFKEIYSLSNAGYAELARKGLK